MTSPIPSLLNALIPYENPNRSKRKLASTPTEQGPLKYTKNALGLPNLPFDCLSHVLDHLSLRDVVNLHKSSKVISKTTDEKAENIFVNRIAIPPHLNYKEIKCLIKNNYPISCENIESLDVENSEIQDELFTNILSRSPNLRYLDASQTSLSDQALDTIGTCCSQLSELNLNYCPQLTYPTLLKIVENNLHLKKLSVIGFNHRGMDEAKILQLAKRCAQLEELSLASVNADSHPQCITDASILAFVRNCPHLRNLDLEGSFELTDLGLKQIVQARPELEELDITDCPLITDDGIIAVALNCPHLRSLKVSSNTSISDESLQAIAEFCSKLERFELNFENYHAEDAFISHIEDKGICALAEKCPHLKELIIPSSQVTDSGIRFLSKKSLFLQHLDLTDCSKVIELDRVAISKMFPHLTKYVDINCQWYWPEDLDILRNQS